MNVGQSNKCDPWKILPKACYICKRVQLDASTAAAVTAAAAAVTAAGTQLTFSYFPEQTLVLML